MAATVRSVMSPGAGGHVSRWSVSCLPVRGGMSSGGALWSLRPADVDDTPYRCKRLGGGLR
ncbi:MAG: hypothetical protein GC192_14770 [Bacteroidetes bacterium]|nr:hypothetical protein [Bacteroidota bacterium]